MLPNFIMMKHRVIALVSMVVLFQEIGKFSAENSVFHLIVK